MSDKKYKIDLHSHSIISHDGGLTAKDYRQLLEKGVIDYIAITDHNDISFAKIMQQKLGDKILIGEEIMTTQGEIIGLFLEKTIAKDLSPAETIHRIKAQHGLVYVPHPFEILRKGIQLSVAKELEQDIDIIEVFNARAFGRGKPDLATNFAESQKIAMAASSDAHVRWGVGTAYSVIEEVPNKQTLVRLLTHANYQKKPAPLVSLLFPSINKIKKSLSLDNYTPQKMK